MDAMTLYLGNKTYSSWSLRPWLALKQAGVSFTEVVIPLEQPETDAAIRRVSPTGRVPVLVDGGLTVWDSLAICEYAAERWPEARLWPEDRALRAEARAVSAEMHAGFAALRERMSMHLRRAPMTIARTPEVERDIARIVEIWTGLRRRHRGAGSFLFGHFTIADAMFAPVVTRFRTYMVRLDGEAAEYADAVWALPAMQEWVAAALAETWTAPLHDAI
jgi:glutathione S-transferase